MYDASSEAKNSADLATSSEVPKRPRGTYCTNPLPISSTISCGNPIFSYKGVEIGPGAVEFTRIPLDFTSEV